MRSQGRLFRGHARRQKPTFPIIKETGHRQAVNCFTFCWHFLPLTRIQAVAPATAPMMT